MLGDVLEAEEKPLVDVPGQVLTEDVVAELPIPPLDKAAIAVRCSPHKLAAMMLHRSHE